MLDRDLTVVYVGRIDDSRTGTGISSRDLGAAIEDVLTGRPVGIRKTDAFGCSIIW